MVVSSYATSNDGCDIRVPPVRSDRAGRRRTSWRLYRVTCVGRVRLSVAERREELLGAAIEQISARGVAALRIADVAAALGVSNALVLYHFSDRRTVEL